MGDAAKYFQVTERTWHNWEIGAHRIPFAVYKLCRVLARLELPGDGWAGWSFQGGILMTPEGRQIAPQDSSWWSLMVRNAKSFTTVYHEANRLRQLLAQTTGAASSDFERQAQRAESGEAAGLVPSKTSRNGQDNSTSNSSHNDVIIEPWPILYDSLPPLTHLHAPKPTTSASPLTPSYALPWTPICGVQLRYQRPTLKPHLATCVKLGQPTHGQNLSNPPSSPEPKSRLSTNSENGSSTGSPDAIEASARPAAAQAAKLASASGGSA